MVGPQRTASAQRDGGLMPRDLWLVLVAQAIEEADGLSRVEAMDQAIWESQLGIAFGMAKKVLSL